MKKLLKRVLLTIGAVVLLILLAGGYLIYRINKADGVAQIRPEDNLLKLGAIEIMVDLEHPPYLDYLRVKAQSPVDYVVEKFKRHDVVLLGEQHEIHENCKLVSELVEPVYRRSGARILGMEVLKQKRSAEINELLTAKLYNEQRIVQIFREDYLYWGFRDYMDILRSVWMLNHSLAEGQERLRVIGLTPDINVYKVMCGSLLQKLPELPRLLGIEESYTTPIVAEVLEKNQKALIFVGYAHTFASYRQASIVEGKMRGEFTRKRMGRILRERYGDRVFQISLHVRQDQVETYTAKPETPVVLFLEKLFAENGSAPIGFDILNSPFALLRDTSSDYFRFQKYVTFEDIAQGYILLKPIDQLSCVEWVPGFIDNSNFQQLRTYALQRRLIAENECKSPEQLEQKFSTMLRGGRRLN